MTKKEKLFISKLLDLAGEKLSLNSCSDITDDVVNLFNQKEIDQLNKKYHKWNGDPEEFEKGNQLLNADFAWIAYFSDKLKEEIQ